MPTIILLPWTTKKIRQKKLVSQHNVQLHLLFYQSEPKVTTLSRYKNCAFPSGGHTSIDLKTVQRLTVSYVSESPSQFLATILCYFYVLVSCWLWYLHHCSPAVQHSLGKMLPIYRNFGPTLCIPTYRNSVRSYYLCTIGHTTLQQRWLDVDTTFNRAHDADPTSTQHCRTCSMSRVRWVGGKIELLFHSRTSSMSRVTDKSETRSQQIHRIMGFYIIK